MLSIIHRNKFRAQQVLQNRAFDNQRMNFTWNSDVKEIIGNENQVTGIKVHNKETHQDEVVPTSGVFTNLKITDEAGWIKTNDQMGIAIPGIYAVSDVRQKKLRQITTAVGDGGIAGRNAFEYIEQLNH